ncbi:hypothetical protein Tco_0596791 [Tanacetum coccineum]
MQCISPKSTGFNEFSSNIATAIVCFATNRTYNFSKMILDGMTSNIKRKSATQTTIPQTLQIPSPTLTPRRLTRSAIRIAQSKALSPGADEPASLQGDVSHGEAFPTVSSLDAGQDRGNVAKTSAMPHDSPPRVTSLGGDEGSMQQTLKELMAFCTNLQSQAKTMAAKIQDQALEITQLKARVKVLEDNDRRRHGISQEEALNRGGEAIRVSGEELAEKETSRSTDKGSESTDEMANILHSMGAANILASGGVKEVATATQQVPTASPAVATTSATIAPAVATTTTTIPTVVTPHSRRTRASKEIELESSQPSFYTSVKTLSSKGKEKVTEPEKLSKRRVQELMGKQEARRLEAEFAQEDQAIRDQIGKDAEIA